MRRPAVFAGEAVSPDAATSCCSIIKATCETSPGPRTCRWGGSSGEALRGMFKELDLNGASALTITGCTNFQHSAISTIHELGTYLKAQAPFAKVFKLCL